LRGRHFCSAALYSAAQLLLKGRHVDPARHIVPANYRPGPRLSVSLAGAPGFRAFVAPKPVPGLEPPFFEFRRHD
jgi:hypothetical protein